MFVLFAKNYTVKLVACSNLNTVDLMKISQYAQK